MGWDVRALFLDRELAEDFVAMDVTVLRLRSLAVEVPPWDFREEAGHPVELSEEGVPQWRCCFDERCEALFESFKALATHVRHHRQVEVVVITNHCPVCLAVHVVISCHRFVVGLVLRDAFLGQAQAGGGSARAR